MSEESSYKLLVTDIGNSMEAESVASSKVLNLLKVGVGSGSNTQEYEVPNINMQTTSLVNEIVRFNISTIIRDSEDKSKFTLYFTIPADVNESDYWVTELGVYGVVGEESYDDSELKLFAVGTVAPTYKPKSEDGSTKELNFKLVFSILDPVEVNLEIDPNLEVLTTVYTGKTIDLNVNADSNDNILNFTEAININSDNIGNLVDLLPICSEDDLVSAINSNYYSIKNFTAIGDIRNFPFTSGSLPFGWYVCNGGRYYSNTNEYNILCSLDEEYKENWNIAPTGVEALSEYCVTRTNGDYSDRTILSINTPDDDYYKGNYQFLTTGVVDDSNTILKNMMAMAIYYKDNGDSTYTYLMGNFSNTKYGYYESSITPDSSLWKEESEGAFTYSYIADYIIVNNISYSDNYDLINEIYYPKVELLGDTGIYSKDVYGLDSSIATEQRRYIVINNYSNHYYNGVYEFYHSGTFTGQSSSTWYPEQFGSSYYRDNGDNTYTYLSVDQTNNSSLYFTFRDCTVLPNGDFWESQQTVSVSLYSAYFSNVGLPGPKLDSINGVGYLKSCFLRDDDYYTDDISNIFGSDNLVTSDYLVINSMLDDECNGVYTKFAYNRVNATSGVTVGNPISPIYYKDNSDGTYNYFAYGDFTIGTAGWGIYVFKNQTVTPNDDFWGIDGSILTNPITYQSYSIDYHNVFNEVDGAWYANQYRLNQGDYYTDSLTDTSYESELTTDDMSTMQISSQDRNELNGEYKYLVSAGLTGNSDSRKLTTDPCAIYYKKYEDEYIYLMYYNPTDIFDGGYYFFYSNTLPTDPRWSETNSRAVWFIDKSYVFYKSFVGYEYKNICINIDGVYFLDLRYLNEGDYYVNDVYTSTGKTSYLQLPNLTDRYIKGITDDSLVGSFGSAELPNITGAVTSYNINDAYVQLFAKSVSFNGALYTDINNWVYATASVATGGYSAKNMKIDSSRISPLYKNTTTVDTDHVKMLPCIYLGI